MLVAAAEGRAAKLVSLSGLSPVFLEALTLMTANSLQPAELGEGRGRCASCSGGWSATASAGCARADSHGNRAPHLRPPHPEPDVSHRW